MSTINIFDKRELYRVQKPGRYTGSEWNIVKESDKKHSFALAFPDAYEIAQSGLGLKILYDIINRHQDFKCERVFAPFPDMEAFLRERNIPLFSLETKMPLKEFDFIGFTLQYEMTYTNILNMLDLSGIPIRSKERDSNYPLVIAGGPCAYNPEPLWEFIDLFVIGDGEDIVDEILDIFTQWKNEKSENREDMLVRLSQIQGVYVPSFYDVEYDKAGSVTSIKTNRTDVPAKAVKHTKKTLNEAPFPEAPVVPYIQSVHDRVMLEIFRGCTRGCRFCKAGYIYRPLRERSVDNLLDIAKKSIDSTGYDEISLMSLSCSDFSKIEELLKSMTDTFMDEGVTVSLPSLRMDNFSLKLAGIVKTPRKSGLTFAPEAGSQRLRDVINKNVTEDQIFETLEQAQSLGWKMIKLYFMMGLPTETDKDIDAIVTLVRQILKRTRLKLHVSVSNFVPQPFTPFQWEPMETREELRRKAYYIKDRLRSRRVQFNYHEPATSLLEGVFARGDRKLSKVIEQAFLNGARFDGWSDYFDFSIWEKAFEQQEVDYNQYLRKRDHDEILPWDIIDAGLTREFLLCEHQKATGQNTTSDCRETCTGCGICGEGIEHKFAPDSSCILVKKQDKPNINDKVQKIRIKISRTGMLKWISHLDMQRTLERALKRAKIPVSYTEGFHPRPRISLPVPLPLGYTSDADWLEIVLYQHISLLELEGELREKLPDGLEIIEIKEIPLSEKSIMSKTLKLSYVVTLPSSIILKEDLLSILEDFSNLREIFINKKNKSVNVKDLIARLEPDILKDGYQVFLDVLMKPSGSVKPDEIIKQIFNEEIALQSDYHRREVLIHNRDKWSSP